MADYPNSSLSSAERDDSPAARLAELLLRQEAEREDRHRDVESRLQVALTRERLDSSTKRETRSALTREERLEAAADRQMKEREDRRRKAEALLASTLQAELKAQDRRGKAEALLASTLQAELEAQDLRRKTEAWLASTLQAELEAQENCRKAVAARQVSTDLGVEELRKNVETKRVIRKKRDDWFKIIANWRTSNQTIFLERPRLSAVKADALKGQDGQKVQKLPKKSALDRRCRLLLQKHERDALAEAALMKSLPLEVSVSFLDRDDLPRWCSEGVGRVPPPRVRDADEPVVPHLYYEPFVSRRFQKPFRKASSGPHLGLRSVIRTKFGMYCVDFGRRILPCPTAS